MEIGDCMSFDDQKTSAFNQTDTPPKKWFRFVHGYFLNFLHTKVCHNRANGTVHSTTVNLFVRLDIIVKVAV